MESIYLVSRRMQPLDCTGGSMAIPVAAFGSELKAERYAELLNRHQGLAAATKLLRAAIWHEVREMEVQA
jgi:hypothetical protein